MFSLTVLDEFLFFLQVKAEFSHGTPVSNLTIFVRYNYFQHPQVLITDINGLANFTIDTSYLRAPITVSVSFLFLCVCMLVLCRFADVSIQKHLYMNLRINATFKDFAGNTFDYVCVLASCSWFLLPCVL